MSSNVPERVGRELYEAPYKAAVDAGVGSVMCSFNVSYCAPLGLILSSRASIFNNPLSPPTFLNPQRINTTWSCANGASLNDWLKGDLGFDGFVV